MKIICVLGGSYKSFYLNHLKSINRCDLLVFNFGLIYNYNVKSELFGDAVVTKELMNLSKALNAIVVAGVYVEGEKIKKSVIMCDGEKIHIADACVGITLETDKTDFVVGDEKMTTKGVNKIVLSNKRIYPDVKHCADKRVYIFCDKFGVNVVKNKNLTRNFNKYFKMILK